MQSIARKDFLKIHPAFTQILLQLQEDNYHPENFALAENDEWLAEEEDAVEILTKERAKDLNAAALKEYQRHKDTSPYPNFPLPEWKGGQQWISKKKDVAAYFEDLAKALVTMADANGWGQCMVIGDWPTPWLAQDNDYPPVQSALQFFRAAVKDDFDGGFLLERSEIATFLPHLFWLGRCNGALPYFWISFEGIAVLFAIPHFGALQVEIFDEQWIAPVFQEMKKFGLVQHSSAEDAIHFDEGL